jgi:hypothetical protein
MAVSDFLAPPRNRRTTANFVRLKTYTHAQVGASPFLRHWRNLRTVRRRLVLG